MTRAKRKNSVQTYRSAEEKQTLCCGMAHPVFPTLAEIILYSSLQLTFEDPQIDFGSTFLVLFSSRLKMFPAQLIFLTTYHSTNNARVLIITALPTESWELSAFHF